MADETEKGSLPDPHHTRADIPAHGRPRAKRFKNCLARQRKKFFPAVKELLTFSREDVDEIDEIPKSDSDITTELRGSTDMTTKEIGKLRNEMRREMDDIHRYLDKILGKMDQMSKRHERSERRLIQHLDSISITSTRGNCNKPLPFYPGYRPGVRRT